MAGSSRCGPFDLYTERRRAKRRLVDIKSGVLVKPSKSTSSEADVGTLCELVLSVAILVQLEHCP